VVQPVAEGTLVQVEEGGVLGSRAVVGDVALGDDGVRCGGDHLGDGGPVHGQRVRVLLRRRAVDRAEPELLHLAAGRLAEVQVVHGGDPGEQLARRPGQGAEGEPVVLVPGVRAQPLVPVHDRAVVAHRLVVGDRGEVHAPGV
jgi:hypothetical protein